MIRFNGDNNKSEARKKAVQDSLYQYEAEIQAKNNSVPQQNFIQMQKPTDILDQTLKGVLGNNPSTPFLPQYEKQIAQDVARREQYPTTDYTYPKAIDTAGTFSSKFLDSATLGLKPLIEKKVDPTGYDFRQKVYDDNKIAGTSGNLTGYLLPGMAIGKGVKSGTTALKSIPKIGNAVSKILPGTNLINKVSKAGLYGATEGALMGGIEGATEGIREGYSLSDIAKNSAIKAGEFGAIGGALGGALTGIGGLAKNLYGNTVGFNKALQRASEGIDNYQAPQIRELQTVQRPLNPTINSIIPKEYQNVPKFESKFPKLNTQLSLPPARIREVAGDPSRTTKFTAEELRYKTPDSTRPILKPLNVEGNVSLPSKGNTPIIKPLNANELKLTDINAPKPKYTPELQSKLNELEQNHKNTINSIKNDKVMNSELKSKQSLSQSMRYSTARRELIQGDSLIPVDGGLTAKELSKKIEKMRTNYAGKPVVTPDGEGVVTGKNSFGKVGVEVNGKVTYYTKEQIQSKVNVDDIIAQQKQAKIKPVESENIQRNIKSPSMQNEPVKTLNTANNKMVTEQPLRQPIQTKSISQIPRTENSNPNMRNRQFIENSYMNSEVTTPKMKENMKNKIPQYESISNQNTLDQAKKIVDSDYEGTVRKFLSENKLGDDVDTAIGEVLIQRAISKGNYLEADDIALNLAKKLTVTGQTMQAASMMKRMTPEGMLKHITKSIDDLKGRKLSEGQIKTIVDNMKIIKLAAQGELKLADINLQLFASNENRALVQRLRELAGREGDDILDSVISRQISDAALDNVSFVAANNLPVTRMDKINAWRRMAMLANPKTHIRNFIGNTIMAGLRKSSDTVGAGFEKLFVKQGERTKSIGWSRDKDIVKAVDDDWMFHRKALMKGGKFDLDTVFLNNEKQIFGKGRLTKLIEKSTGKEYERGILEAINQISRDTLNASDNIFLQRAYKDALGGYMKANGLKSVTNEARLYATRRGYEAVFKQANELSNWISRMKSKGGFTGAVLEAKIPFSKTPSNIALRGVEYSPLGIIKALYSKVTGKTAATVIEDFSKGLTGTAIYGIGISLAAMGWARTETSKSKALKSLSSESGKQPYSIDTPFGSYTFEWAQPTSIPLAMGIATFESLSKKNKGEDDVKTYETIMKSLASGGDTLFNTTMLRNITDMFGGKYGSPTEALLSVPEDYIQQSVPSILSMITKSIDNTKRDTSGGIVDVLKSKTPFLSKTLPAKLDLYGREEKQPGIFQQFLSPGTFKANSNDATSRELIRLNKATGETKFLPSIAQDKLSYQTGKNEDSKKLLLPPNLKQAYAKTLGQSSKLELDKIINSLKYINASDKDKVKQLDSTMNAVKEKTESDLLKQLNIKEYKASSSSRNRSRR